MVSLRLQDESPNSASISKEIGEAFVLWMNTMLSLELELGLEIRPLGTRGAQRAGGGRAAAKSKN